MAAVAWERAESTAKSVRTVHRPRHGPARRRCRTRLRARRPTRLGTRGPAYPQGHVYRGERRLATERDLRPTDVASPIVRFRRRRVRARPTWALRRLTGCAGRRRGVDEFPNGVWAPRGGRSRRTDAWRRRQDESLIGSSGGGAGSVEDCLVGCDVKAEIRGVQRVMTVLDEDSCQARREILVDQEPHAGRVSGSSRSRTASAA